MLRNVLWYAVYLNLINLLVRRLLRVPFIFVRSIDASQIRNYPVGMCADRHVVSGVVSRDYSQPVHCRLYTYLVANHHIPQIKSQVYCPTLELLFVFQQHRTFFSLTVTL